MNQRIKLTLRTDDRLTVWFLVMHIICWTSWPYPETYEDEIKVGSYIRVTGGVRFGVMESIDEVGRLIDEAMKND